MPACSRYHRLWGGHKSEQKQHYLPLQTYSPVGEADTNHVVLSMKQRAEEKTMIPCMYITKESVLGKDFLMFEQRAERRVEIMEGKGWTGRRVLWAEQHVARPFVQCEQGVLGAWKQTRVSAVPEAACSRCQPKQGRGRVWGGGGGAGHRKPSKEFLF